MKKIYIKKKKRKIRDKPNTFVINYKILIYIFIILFFAIFLKKFFFISIFVILNFLILNFFRWAGIKIPVEVISFETTMCGYVYGPIEAVIVVSSSWISILASQRIGPRILFSNLLLTFMGIIVHRFNDFDIVLVGIAFIFIRYLIQFTFEFFYAGSAKVVSLIPHRIVNIIFWIFIYSSFGNDLVSLMQIK